MCNELCLFCLEDLNFTEILKKPSQCNCNVILHQNCLKLIENTGLMCPICRIRKSPNIRTNTRNNNSFLVFFSNKCLEYFTANTNAFGFIVFFLGSCLVTVALIPKLVWVGLNDSIYRFRTLIFLGIISIASFEILKLFLY